MKHLILALLLAISALAGGSLSSSNAATECADPLAWPSFAEVAETAFSIYLVKVTRSDDGIAQQGRSRDVMRGSAPGKLDFSDLQPGQAPGCPVPEGPYAEEGDRLLVAYDGRAADRDGSVDAVAFVGRNADAENRSGLERLTPKEARAYDAPRTTRRIPKEEPTPKPASWSPRPSLLPATADDTTELWSCGGEAPGFPLAVLDGPSGMERVQGAVFAGLRKALRTMRPEFEFDLRGDRPHELPWLLAYEDDDLALFLVKRAGTDERYSVMYVGREGKKWGFSGFADTCGLRPLVTHGFGDSVWRITPGTALDTASTSIPIEVTEGACASGQPATGRIEEPIVDYGDEAITVTVPVRPVEGGANCPGNPWTPYVLELTEPVGDRILLDGGPWPPAQRWPEP